MAAHLLKDGGTAVKTTRPNKTNLIYDPTTGLWRPSLTQDNSVYDPTTGQFRKPITQPSTQKTGNSTPNVDSQKDADKEYIEAEFNILTGEMRVTPSTKTIRIRVNDTVKIEGLGKYLSGLYFVSAISRNISASDGYSHSLHLIRNGFGDSIKKAPPVVEEPRREEVPKAPPTYNVGDKVKIVGEDAVYSNAHNGVKVPNWVKQKTHTIYQVSDDKTRVLLKEIWSWTYVKYIQKV